MKWWGKFINKIHIPTDIVTKKGLLLRLFNLVVITFDIIGINIDIRSRSRIIYFCSLFIRILRVNLILIEIRRVSAEIGFLIIEVFIRITILFLMIAISIIIIDDLGCKLLCLFLGDFLYSHPYNILQMLNLLIYFTVDDILLVLFYLVDLLFYLLELSSFLLFLLLFLLAMKLSVLFA